MKLEISYNTADLEEAVRIAAQTAEFADTLHLGSLLLLSNGRQALERFREMFPTKDLSLDTKLTELTAASIDFFAAYGVKQVSVLAGISNKTIQQFAVAAHGKDMKIALDLVACSQPEQGVFDAQTLEVDVIIYRNPLLKDDAVSSLDRWASVRGNTSLPIYIGGTIAFDALGAIREMGPEGVIIGGLITNASNPREMAEKIRDALGS